MTDMQGSSGLGGGGDMLAPSANSDPGSLGTASSPSGLQALS